MMDWIVFAVAMLSVLVSVYVLGFVRGVSKTQPKPPRKRLPFMAGRFGP